MATLVPRSFCVPGLAGSSVILPFSFLPFAMAFPTSPSTPTRDGHDSPIEPRSWPPLQLMALWYTKHIVHVLVAEAGRKVVRWPWQVTRTCNT